MAKTTRQYQERQAVTDWKSWSDIFKAYAIRDVAYHSKLQRERDARDEDTAHTWYVEDWSARDPKHARKLPCYLSRYCQIKLQPEPGTWRSFSLTITPTEQAIEVLSHHVLHVEYDTLSWKVIEWTDGRALVAVENSKIIGGPWLAKIDSSTIPADLRKVQDDE